MITRDSLFESASNKLRAEFEDARNIPHAGERGREGEGILLKFLNDHIPRRFAATSGFILDEQDNVSRQTDVIVYDAYNCPVIRVFQNSMIIPNDHAVAVIEVKSNLTKAGLKEAAENIAKSKMLLKSWIPKVFDYTPDITMTTATLGVIFAFEAETSLQSLTDNWAELLIEYGDKPGTHIDFIFVLDVGMICMGRRGRGLVRKVDEGYELISDMGDAKPKGGGSFVIVQVPGTRMEAADGKEVNVFEPVFSITARTIPHKDLELQFGPGETARPSGMDATEIFLLAPQLGKYTLDAFLRTLTAYFQHFVNRKDLPRDYRLSDGGFYLPILFTPVRLPILKGVHSKSYVRSVGILGVSKYI